MSQPTSVMLSVKVSAGWFVFCGTLLPLPEVAVSNHLALWCPDFPPAYNRRLPDYPIYWFKVQSC